MSVCTTSMLCGCALKHGFLPDMLHATHKSVSVLRLRVIATLLVRKNKFNHLQVSH